MADTEVTHAFCSLTRDEVRAISPDLSRLRAVQVDRHMTVYVDPTKSPDEIKHTYAKIKSQQLCQNETTFNIWAEYGV